MPGWLQARSVAFLAWLNSVPWLPSCLKSLLRDVFTSLVHAAAVAFGFTFCFLSMWDVCVEHHGFNAVSYGAGALSIMTGWAASWRLQPQDAANIPSNPGA